MILIGTAAAPPAMWFVRLGKPVCVGFRFEINPDEVPEMCCSVEEDIGGC